MGHRPLAAKPVLEPAFHLTLRGDCLVLLSLGAIYFVVV